MKEPHYSEEELLEDVRRVAEIVGGTPTQKEYMEHGIVSTQAMKERFGKWSDVHRAAGLEPREKEGIAGLGARYDDIDWSDLNHATDGENRPVGGGH